MTNEVFALLCAKWDRLNREQVRAWLYRTADNIVREYLRKDRKRRREVVYIEELDSNAAHELMYEEDFEGVSDEVIEMYREEIVSSLSAAERELFDMAYVEKLPRAEIREILKVGESALKKRLYRLRRKIAEAVCVKIE